MAQRLSQQSFQKMSLANIPSSSSSEFHQRSSSHFFPILFQLGVNFSMRLTFTTISTEYLVVDGVVQMKKLGVQLPGILTLKFNMDNFFPGKSTVVDFNEVDVWTDIFWASNYILHQNFESQRKSHSSFTHFDFYTFTIHGKHLGKSIICFYQNNMQ